MKIVIQRVKHCEVLISSNSYAKSNYGMLILLGIGSNETEEDLNYLIKKILNLRIFNDENHIPNLSVQDIKGEIMIVSQFTLFAATKKGNRPSYSLAGPPDIAQKLYTQFIQKIKSNCDLNIYSGKFGANMQIQLTNDGPYTLFLDSKNKD